MRVHFDQTGHRRALFPRAKGRKPDEAQRRQARHDPLRDPVPGRRQHRQELLAEGLGKAPPSDLEVCGDLRERAMITELPAASPLPA